MTKEDSALQEACRYVVEQIEEAWDSLGKNNLWKRILKNVTATTLLVSICLIPGSRSAIGKAAYLGAITTVFGHPGRRFGQMTEALILAASGTVLGVAWSILGVYLGSLVVEKYPPATYAIRGIFLAIATLFHGFLRSRTPRLFIFVLLMIIVSVVSLTSTATAVSTLAATQILYPIFIAVGCIILVNVSLFPEFSSTFLGQMTIDTLYDTAKTLEEGGQYFIEAELSRATAESSSQPSEESGQPSSAATEQNGSLAKQGSQSAKASSFHTIRDRIRSPLSNTAGIADREGVKSGEKIHLKDLTGNKGQIRKKLDDCKAAQQECNFELAFSVLPPRNLKPISVQAMKKLVANTIAVISACESKFALLGEDKDPESDQREKQIPGNETTKEGINATGLSADDTNQQKSSAIIDQDRAELEMIKPKREIEFGNARLLRYLLARVAEPYQNLHKAKARSIEVVASGIAYAYDVPTLPTGARTPKGIMLEEMDLHLNALQQALVRFDVEAASAFEGAAALQELEGREPDIMPREEVFLMSSFMLNVRQAASHIEDMLEHSRELVEERQAKFGRRRLYAPRIKWSKWLNTGGEEDEAPPAPARKANRPGDPEKPEDDDDDADSSDSKKNLLASKKQEDLENKTHVEVDGGNRREKPNLPDLEPTRPPKEKHVSRTLRLRGQAADAVEWVRNSDDVLYALKLTVAVFLVIWPSLVASWNTWYSLNRGLWAALQLVLITEVSIGTSVNTFILRSLGTTLGCIWGWVALEARNENRIVCAVMICIALFPCAYVQLGTKYPKAGMVCIVSICVVTLSTEIDTVPGSATENFLKRWISFLIGGIVALIVEVVLLPVKARTRLVESLAAALHQINEMEKCIAAGIESGVKIDVYAAENYLRFEHASGKANTALSAAETFLPFCSKEPRIKGSFEGLALIYNEIIVVLHQIVDRMDNMLQLRTAYGSGPLEDFNAEIYPYRRNVAGSITLTLFAINGALSNKLPLPQFLPSARLTHLRMINRVREVVLEKVSQGLDAPELATKLVRQRALRRKYMSWNASSAAQAEIIEFLEELIDLTKLLVGANEFRSGLLTRPTYKDYAGKGNGDEAAAVGEARDEIRDTTSSAGLTKRRRGTTLSAKSNGEDIPASLRRIQSRKTEAGVRGQKTNESWGQAQQHGSYSRQESGPFSKL